jgi:hypothetical protein
MKKCRREREVERKKGETERVRLLKARRILKPTTVIPLSGVTERQKHVVGNVTVLTSKGNEVCLMKNKGRGERLLLRLIILVGRTGQLVHNLLRLFLLTKMLEALS